MSQLALIFDAPPAPAYTVARARADGEVQGQRCADRAERQDDGFRERAAAFVLGYLAQHGVSSGELITDAAKLAGIRPPDARAFGPIYAKLLRDKRIKRVGECARRHGHGTRGGSVYALWEA